MPDTDRSEPDAIAPNATVSRAAAESADQVRLPTPERERLDAWASAGYPHEVCGLLTGRRRDGVVEVVRAVQGRNLRQDRAGDRYELDPDDFLAEDRRARADGLDVVGFWHTHPDHPARPSPADLDAAWPGYTYLIVTTTPTGTGDFRCWELEDGAFVETRLTEPEPTEHEPNPREPIPREPDEEPA